MTRYGDLHLGFADASVVACAERNGGAMLTFDRRDFDVIARDVPITVVPEEAP
jgi:predicted nucleic acid-binding protein